MKMLAGPPAANTRRTELGTSTRRPAPSTIARRWARATRGAARATTAAPMNRLLVSTRRASSCRVPRHRDHDARLQGDSLHVAGYATIGRAHVHVQIGVPGREDATVPCRVEAEHLHGLSVDLE